MKTSKLFLGMMMSCGLYSAQAQQDSANLYQKAEQLLITMNMPDVFSGAINESVEQQIASAPALTNYRADVKSFFDKCMSWTVVKTDLEKLYLKYYNAEEIDALIKFYQSPAGKKSAAINSNLTKETQTMVQSKVQAHVSEWNQFLSEKVNGKSSDAAAPGNN